MVSQGPSEARDKLPAGLGQQQMRAPWGASALGIPLRGVTQQTGVDGGGDVQYKAENHQVLMVPLRQAGSAELCSCSVALLKDPEIIPFGSCPAGTLTGHMLIRSVWTATWNLPHSLLHNSLFLEVWKSTEAFFKKKKCIKKQNKFALLNRCSHSGADRGYPHSPRPSNPRLTAS